MTHRLKFDQAQVAALLAKTKPAGKIYFVKDDGIYLMTFDEVGYTKGNRLVVYARGFTPGTPGLWDKTHDVSGDDFGEVIATREQLAEIVADAVGDIVVNVSENTFSVSYHSKTPTSEPRKPFDVFQKGRSWCVASVNPGRVYNVKHKTRADAETWVVINRPLILANLGTKAVS